MLSDDTRRVRGFDFTFYMDDKPFSTGINTDQVNTIGVVIGKVQLPLSTLNRYIPIQDFLPIPLLGCQPYLLEPVVDGRIVKVACTVIHRKTHCYSRNL